MNRTRLYNVWLPLALMIVALIVINFGLYVQLSANPITESIQSVEFPFSDSFETTDSLNFPQIGGDWDIRDETLVQISTSGYDLGLYIPLTIPEDQPYTFNVDLQYLGGTMGGGLLFNSQNVNARQLSHMVRFNVDNDVLYVVYGYFAEDSNFVGQGSYQLSQPSNSNEVHRLGVEISENTYNILLNDNRILTELELMYRGGAVGLITSTSQVAFDNVVAEPWSPDNSFVQTDVPIDIDQETPITSNEVLPLLEGSLILADSFDTTGGDGENLWIPFSGEWAFGNGNLSQNLQDGFDFGIGYNQFYENISLQTSFQHQTGQGAGVLFNMPQVDTNVGAHMVRYVHDSDFIMWGYFDPEDGFIGQGSTPVSPAGDTLHTLQIITTDDTYAIILDGETIATNIPLLSTAGYVGLTTAQSIVDFNSIEIYTSNAAPLDTLQQTNTTNVDLNAISGEWEFGDNRILQTNNDETDFIAGTGVAAEAFTISVQISFPDLENNPNVGAGLIFHMNEREDIALGQMVRFGSGGNEIFWGSYDENRAFAGLGGAPLSLDWSIPHTLSLVVRNSTYDIQVDDVVIVTDVPFTRDFGWIGLISFSGPVEYSDFELSLGQF